MQVHVVLWNAIEYSTDYVSRSDLQKTLNNHLNSSKTETEYLNPIRAQSNFDSAELIPVIIDFAENVLFPFVLHQPGQLHFITGLKNDFFCISCASNETNYVLSLAEGHWTDGKTASEVSSMFFTVLEMILAHLGGKSRSKLMIHCDNCEGQFKNKFFTWFCSWLTAARFILISWLWDTLRISVMVLHLDESSEEWRFEMYWIQKKCAMLLMRVLSQPRPYPLQLCYGTIGRSSYPQRSKINSYHQFQFGLNPEDNIYVSEGKCLQGLSVQRKLGIVSIYSVRGLRYYLSLSCNKRAVEEVYCTNTTARRSQVRKDS